MQHSRSRAEVNRENALKSTGPRTAEGKARSSQNSLKHGLFAEHLLPVVQSGLEADLDALRDQLFTEHNPATPTEKLLVEELVQNYWRTLRFRRHEAAYWEGRSPETFDMNFVLQLQRVMTATERAFAKALTQLRTLQRDRAQKESAAAAEAKKERFKTSLHRSQGTEPKTATALSGFVPQNRASNTVHPASHPSKLPVTDQKPALEAVRNAAESQN